MYGNKFRQLKLAVNYLKVHSMGRLETQEEIDKRRYKERIRRKDINNKKIDPSEEYVLVNRTNPEYYYSGGYLADPQMVREKYFAQPIPGELLKDSEYNWEYGWDAVKHRELF